MFLPGEILGIKASLRLVLMFLFQMIWFRENWYEELLRQLNEGLALCQASAFENRTDGRSPLLVMQ